MPITCRFDPDRQVLLETATDTLTAPALLESHTRRRPHGATKALSDYRATTLHATAPELRMLATALEAVEAGQQWAWAVVIQDPASFGLFRMLGAFLEPKGVRLAVFRGMEEAEDWLEGPRGMMVNGNA